jgi:hypothetical protein
MTGADPDELNRFPHPLAIGPRLLIEPDVNR